MTSKCWPGLDVPPPVTPIDLPVVLNSLRLHMEQDMLKWCFVQCGFRFGHRPTEINDPLVGRAARDIHRVAPRLQHIAVRPTIWVEREAQPLPGQVAGNVEGTALGVAHESDASILPQACGLGQVDAGRGQIRIDAVDCHSIKTLL